MSGEIGRVCVRKRRGERTRLTEKYNDRKKDSRERENVREGE